MKITRMPDICFPKQDIRPQQYGMRTLKTDVFEKSKTPSFGSDPFLDALIDGFLLSTIDSLVNNVTEIVHETIQESQLKALINIYSQKQNKTFFDQNRTMKMRDLVRSLYATTSLKPDFLIDLFEETKINTVFSFQNYLKEYNKAPETRQIFAGQEIESLRIYSQLKCKDDLSKYGALLLHVYNQNASQTDENRKVDLNELTDFLKKIGITNFKDFDKKFAHLKPDYNNFENISDKYEAVLYLMHSYPQKADYINQVLQEHPQGKNVNAEKIYSSNPDIIDYLYEQNNGHSLEPLSAIIDQISSDKIGRPALKKILEFNGELTTPEDRVDFYMFLNEAGCVPDDINAMARSSVISDNDFLACIVNRNFFVSEISLIKGFDEKQSIEFYRKFSDLLNVLYSQTEADNSGLKTFFGMIDMFGIKNSFDVLSKYNEINGVNKKSVSAQEFRDFIDIIAYCSSKDILKAAKAKKIKPIDILNAERQKFLNAKGQIEEFLLSDETGYFLGLSTRDLYLKYKSFIDENPDNVKDVLNNIIKLNIENSSDYTKKTERLKDFESYFGDRKALFDFIEKTNIKFDDTPEDEKYIDNCKKLLRLLKGCSNEDEYKSRLNYIMQSDFMTQSKNSLDKFFADFAEEQEASRILGIITDKKIPSVNDFMAFIKKYEDREGNYDNLLTQLEDLPKDIDFKEYSEILQSIRAMLDDTCIPVRIDNQNIGVLNIRYSRGKEKFSNESRINILNLLSGVGKEDNFISTLDRSYTNRTKKYSAFDISTEIVNKIYAGEDSYNNIIDLLKLDKQTLGLSQDSADYIYVKAIASSLPKEFLEFFNSIDWISFDEKSDKVPNLSLHAKLRLLDRFALENCRTIDDLYKDSTKEYVKSILRAIYTTRPTFVSADKQDKRIITTTQFENDNIKTVFGKNGEMVTIIAKGR